MFLASLSWALQNRVGPDSWWILQNPYCRDIGFLRAAASPDPFTTSGSVICVEWKGVGDCAGVLPKGSGVE